jgi:stearoyl-CoA desaturase (delta-9 desaturase)
MALFTFGEGYHNFHHEFQHDFRNGVKFLQWDPTKWMILILKRIGLADNLRRAPAEKILMAEMSEARRQIDASLKAWSGRIVDSYPEALHSVLDGLHETSHRLAAEYKELQDTVRQRIETSRDRIKAWRLGIRLALEELESLSKFDALYQTA